MGTDSKNKKHNNIYATTKSFYANHQHSVRDFPVMIFIADVWVEAPSAPVQIPPLSDGVYS